MQQTVGQESRFRAVAQSLRLFFFKQKTAYEIGLGIPAEPLFRSCVLLQYLGYDATPFNQILKQNAKREMRLRLGKVTVADVLAAQRSEERRVGKECRSRWSPCQ